MYWGGGGVCPAPAPARGRGEGLLTYLGFILAQGGGLANYNFRRNHLFFLTIQIYWQNLF